MTLRRGSPSILSPQLVPLHLVRGAQVDLDRSVDHAEHALVELDRAGQDCLALGSELRAAIRPKYLRADSSQFS